MAKVKNNEEILENAELQTKSFFAKHSKTIIGAIIAVLIIVLGIALWQIFWVQPREHKAQVALYPVQANIESQEADFAQALTQIDQIVKEYESTTGGNLAQYYGAAAALREGNLDLASKYINEVEELDGLAGAPVNALVKCLKGDIAVEKKQYAEAVKLYNEAAKHINNFTTPLALYKAAVVYIALGNESQAQSALQKIVDSYPGSLQAADARKMLK